MRYIDFIRIGILPAVLILASCGEDSTTEKIVEVGGSSMEVVSEVSQLPACSSANEGEMVWVKDEIAPRKCSEGLWFAVAEGNSMPTCSADALPDGSGVKIICNGDSIGVLLNGENGNKGPSGILGENGPAGRDGQNGKDGASGSTGLDGMQGPQGEKGETGSAGADCTIENVDELTVRVSCGTESTLLYIGLSNDTSGQDTVVLDSEKIAISLDEVSGATQKGPFLMGSKVLVREMEDGRTLTQTGNSFNGKILNDKGEFRINARMLVSQYVMLETTGYYRNEVTGKNSNSELTLFAIADVNDRNIVNVNLLTHLEYERVIYLVTQKKMKVKAAKKQAQKEVFALLDIDAASFLNSEDLNIAGSSDGDGALLAFSVMFQGNRSVADLTALLQTVANDMEKDGTWDDASTRMKIAEWAADADSAALLAAIRNNVKDWGLSDTVPDFERFVRHFWYSEYGLGNCDADSVGVVKAATAGKRKGSATRYTCRDNRWQVASDIEKDTYGWGVGKDGDFKKGSVTGKKYLYDAVAKSWRDASLQEQELGACTESVAADMDKNVGLIGDTWYKCENRAWIATTDDVADTRGWKSGVDGDVKKGNYTQAYYVFDEVENGWRKASDDDTLLGLKGCTTNRTGETSKSVNNSRYYTCSMDHAWILTDKVVYNTLNYDCDTDGKMVTGAVDTKTYFVCENGSWREATISEELAGAACSAGLEGNFNKDSTRVCENNEFRVVNIYDFDVGVKNYFNPEVTYGTLQDDRDGRVYKTVTVNGMTVMAENLNYSDEKRNVYLANNNWCHNFDTTNCLKGGRYYTWTAALDIDSKWFDGTVPEGTIKTPHRGICPEGWHVPSRAEWESLLTLGENALIASGIKNWPYATNSSGFSAIPTGYCYARYGTYRNEHLDGFYFWVVEEASSTCSVFCTVDNCIGYGYEKDFGMTLRCIKDNSVE